MPPMTLRQATHDFEPYDPDEELTLKEGDVIIVLGESDEDEGWLIGKIQGTSRKGLFPENFTMPYVEEDEDEDDEEVDKEDVDDEDEAEDQFDDAPFYEPPGKKSDGRIAVPTLNHVSMRKDQFRPMGVMNVELPQLRKVEIPNKDRSSSSTTSTTSSGLIEKPQLRKVELPTREPVSSSTTSGSFLERPQLRHVELPQKEMKSIPSSPSILAEKPAALTRVESNRSNVPTAPMATPGRVPLTPAAYLKPTSSSAAPKPPIGFGYIPSSAPTTPRGSFTSSGSISPKSSAPPVALPGLAKPTSQALAPPPLMASSSFKAAPLQPITEATFAMPPQGRRPNAGPAPIRAPRKSMRMPASSSLNGMKSGPLMMAMAGSSSTTMAPPGGGNNVVTTQIPARSLTVTEPPPDQFYTASVDTYTCNVQLTQSDKMTEKVETFQIKRADRSQVKLTIRQVSGEPKANVIAIIQQFRSMSDADLEKASEQYGPKIVAFCQSQFGKRVGDGECWTLAQAAFKAAGCAGPVAYNFGQEIPLEKAKPGDVLQFQSCVFEFPNGGGKQYAGKPNHTAIVAGPMSDSVVPVFEQNPKPCSYGSYDFSCLTSGKVTLFRPLPPTM